MTIVFVGTAGKRTSSIALRISAEHKTHGSYKDDRTSDRVDVFYFCWKRKEKTYKGFNYFFQEHDQESCGTHLFLLDRRYFVPHFTLEVNRSWIYAARFILLKPLFTEIEKDLNKISRETIQVQFDWGFWQINSCVLIFTEFSNIANQIVVKKWRV